MSPFYSYKCEECGIQFDKKQGYSADTTTECVKCGGVAKRQMPIVNHSFGWRLTEKSHERFAKDELEKAV